MDKAKAIDIVRKYKNVISPRFNGDMKVYMYGSYSKGNARPESDIDVAVVVPELKGDWLDMSAKLWLIAPEVNYLIEPVLIDKRYASPLYDDIMRTGIAI